MHQLVATLDEAAPALPTALVGAQARDRLRAAAACLPAALTTRVYLECPLGRASDRADLIVLVDHRGRAWLRRDRMPLPSPAEQRSAEGWTAVEAFAANWNPEASAVAGLWLELDLPPGAEPLPAPRLFLDYRRASGRPLAPSLVAPLVTLIGSRPLPELVSCLQRCF